MTPAIKRNLARASIALLVIVTAWWGISYVLSLRELTVTYQNVHNVQIYTSSALDSGKSPKSKNIATSGQKIKLPKGDYTIHYDGNKDYESKYIFVSLNKKQTVTIKPYYSENKLASLLPYDSIAAQAAITAKYPRASQYKMQQGKLYHYGDWYGTTLTYQGTDIFDTDTIRIIVHKIKDGWDVASQPPNVTLSKFDFPDIPLDVLRDVNSQ